MQKQDEFWFVVNIETCGRQSQSIVKAVGFVDQEQAERAVYIEHVGKKKEAGDEFVTATNAYELSIETAKLAPLAYQEPAESYTG